MRPIRTCPYALRAVIASLRYWLPLDAGFILMLASVFVGPVLTWLMLMIAFGLILDGATAMWERAGGIGNLSTHRQ
jgi:hypothetical protein